MKKLKKIFSTYNIKLFITFMAGSMLVALLFTYFLMKYFDYANVSPAIFEGKLFWHVIDVAFFYSLLLYALLQIVIYFDKNN